MTITPLMPKATAVWLVDNTSLSFDQIADLCHLHPLEVKAIADGDSAQGIKGLDPVLTGQLTREEIAAAEADPNYVLQMLKGPEQVRRTKGPRYTPVSKRQDKPDGIAWMVDLVVPTSRMIWLSFSSAWLRTSHRMALGRSWRRDTGV